MCISKMAENLDLQILVDTGAGSEYSMLRSQIAPLPINFTTYAPTTPTSGASSLIALYTFLLLVIFTIIYRL